LAKPGETDAGDCRDHSEEHLRCLYAKTGTSRQADLVKLVAGFSSPSVDD
jgi:hypothetical protein